MSFLSTFFRKEKRGESAALIDIGADSIAGACVRFAEDEMPTVLYARRLPIEVRKDETHERAMVRALSLLGDNLIREGAPLLARTVGSGRIDTIFVSIGESWQKSSVRTENFDPGVPFVFTRDLVAERLEETKGEVSDAFRADESIIGTTLNGYAIRNPYGKKTRRASVVILTSLIERDVLQGVATTLQRLYHTKNILPVASSALYYQAICAAFPHEHEALILTAFGKMSSLTLMRHGLLVVTTEVSNDPTKNEAWATEVMKKCAELAKQYPLPRTIFLLAPEPDIASLRHKLESTNLNTIWFSNNPPRIVPVLRGHIAGLVRSVTTPPADLSLLLMALYYQYRTYEREE